jgi:hypothetical protein
MTILLLILNMAFASEYHCVMESGDVPKLKFRGETMEEAMGRTAKLCLNLRIQNYHSKRLHPPSDERKILFMEDCVNSTYCKRIEKEQSNEQ